MKFESEFDRWLERLLRPEVTYQRIETMMSQGIPDVNLCKQGIDVWVELKIFVSGRVLLRPEQYAWGIRRCGFGGRVFVLAYHPDPDEVFVWQYPFQVLVHGKYVWINSQPDAIFDRKRQSDNLKSYLFT